MIYRGKHSQKSYDISHEEQRHNVYSLSSDYIHYISDGIPSPISHDLADLIKPDTQKNNQQPTEKNFLDTRKQESVHDTN
jgi:hypothetical protein